MSKKKKSLGTDPLGFIKDTRDDENRLDEVPAKEEVVVEKKSEEKPSTVKDSSTGDKILDGIKEESFSITLKGNEKESYSITFDISGDMNIYNINRINDFIVDNYKDYSNLKLDLSSVKKIDTAGFQLIILLIHTFKKEDKVVTITEYSDEVKSIFDFYGEKIAS